MKETFITNIEVKESRNLYDFNIPLAKGEKRHLIITGKNGSGKTSLLVDINDFLIDVYHGLYARLKEYTDVKFKYTKALEKLEKNPHLNAPQINELENLLKNYTSPFPEKKLNINFSNENTLIDEVEKGKFIIAFFEADRIVSFKTPKSIKKLTLKKKYRPTEEVSENFIQYIVNLYADRSFARDEQEFNTVSDIDSWFISLEKTLKTIFDNKGLKLSFDRKNYNFLINEENKKPYNFNQLPAGYSSIMNIITELILRMEAHKVKSYDLGGIVLIDEIETHLHIDLQKKILPLLISFFPKIQFIVSTHSPFIISSIANATICDLEQRIVTNDLSSYSYDTIVESYFDSDKYSLELKKKLNHYENLLKKKELTIDEKVQIRFLKNYFNSSPKYLSLELMSKLKELELIGLTNINKK